MKVKNGDIWQSRAPLSKVAAMKLPVKVSFGVAKLAVKLAEPYKAIEDVRIGLLKTYGEDRGGGRMEVVGPNDPEGRPVSPKWEQFASEFNELMDLEVELVFDKLKLPQMLDGAALEIEPNLLISLEKFVEFG